MFEQLFGSKTRVKLLGLFFTNPNRSFYVREITRKIDEQINSVRRELANLLSIGIITSDANNNRLYYEVNQSYEHYKPLAAIFGGAKMEPEPVVEEGKAPKKVVLENGWFSRGSLIMVTGFRRGDIFKPKRYKNSIYQHALSKIVEVREDNELILQNDRVQLVE